MNKSQTENFKCNFFEIVVAPEIPLIMMFLLIRLLNQMIKQQ